MEENTLHTGENNMINGWFFFFLMADSYYKNYNMISYILKEKYIKSAKKTSLSSTFIF